MVEAEREQRFFQVSQEVFEDAGDDVDIVHLAKQRDSLAAEKLLLELLHLTIGTRQTVQTDLRGAKNSFTNKIRAAKTKSHLIYETHSAGDADE